MSKRTYRNMSFEALAIYAAEELEDTAGRVYQNGLCTKGRYTDLLHVAEILREKAERL